MGERERGPDVARGLAVFSMYVAHTGPADGQVWGFPLADYLTFPLFGLLVGVGAELARRRSTPRDHLVASLVRASALVAVGLLLVLASSGIVIVLAQLGVLTLLCWGVSRLPSLPVAVVGVVAWLLAPWVVDATQPWRAASSGMPLQLPNTVASDIYPQAVLLFAACAGVLLTRWLVPSRGVAPPRSQVGVVGLALLVAWAALVAADVRGAITVEPYTTTWVEQVFVVLLASGVFVMCVVAARVLGRRLAPLARVGAMTFTLYVLQICYLSAWAHVLAPGASEDTWWNVALLCAGSLVLATVWPALRLDKPWDRGPLEGAVGVAVGSAVARWGTGSRDRVPATARSA